MNKIIQLDKQIIFIKINWRSNKNFFIVCFIQFLFIH